MKKRIIFSIQKNVYRTLENKIYNDAYYSMQNPNLLFKRIYFAEEFINILITLAFSKDPVPFANWLAKNMGETDF